MKFCFYPSVTKKKKKKKTSHTLIKLSLVLHSFFYCVYETQPLRGKGGCYSVNHHQAVCIQHNICNCLINRQHYTDQKTASERQLELKTNEY